MTQEEINTIREYFVGVEIKQSTAKKAYKNPIIKDIIDRLLSEIPEYQTPIRAIYCIVKNIELRKCPQCGKLMNYQKSVVNNQTYCSYKCNSNSDEVRKKKEATCLKKYGVSNFARSDVVKNKRKNTLLRKYGAESTFNIQSVRDKIKKAMLDRYGVENASQAECVKEKKKQKAIERYGVENVFQSEEIKDKSKKTLIKKYGVDNVSYLEEVKNKRKETTNLHFGVDVPAKSDVVLSKMRITNIERYGVEHYCNSDEYKVVKFNKMKEKFKNYVVPLFNAEDYLGTRGDNRNEIYKWKCVKCGNEFEQHIHLTTIEGVDTYIPRCLKCYPYINGTSFLENEIYSFVESIYKGEIERNTRKIIPPYELDIYIPYKKVAIEFDGLYWHSEENVGSNYHLNKLNLCSENGIRLIHVFEDEWVYKKDIVKDRIMSILGIDRERIFARKCDISEIDSSVVNKFLEENHLQGADKSSVRYGLFYKGELVSVMTFGKPRFNDNYDFELIRFASKIGIHVVGGAGKLLAYFENLNKGKTLISYADKRFSNGKLYFSLGFTFLRSSEPNYWWTKYQVRLSRYQCQKHKLKSVLGDAFDVNESESVNMVRNGYHKIYDCGNLVFAKTME